MKSCQDNIERISRLLDRELSAKETEDLLAHLDECAECSERFENYSAVRDVIADMKAPPKELITGVTERTGPKADNKRKSFSRFTFSLTAAAILIVVGVVTFPMLFSKNNSEPFTAGTMLGGTGSEATVPEAAMMPPSVNLGEAGTEDKLFYGSDAELRSAEPAASAVPDDDMGAAVILTQEGLPYDGSYSIYAIAEGSAENIDLLSSFTFAEFEGGVDYFIPSDQIKQVLADLSKEGLDARSTDLFKNQSDSAETAVLRIIEPQE